MKIYKGLFLASFFFLSLNQLFSSNTQNMVGDLTTIKNLLKTSYAPSKWKKEFANWNLEDAYNCSTNEIVNKIPFRNRDFRKTVNRFIHSMQDYHVKVLFTSTEAAFLPFSVKGINGKYFISWVDPGCTSLKGYAIQTGDELISFEGKPIEEVIIQIKEDAGFIGNNPTEQSLVEYSLTNRAGKRGEIVPKGPILITVKNSEGTLKSSQLIWDYYKELINYPLPPPFASDIIETNNQKMWKNLKSSRLSMLSPMGDLYEGYDARPNEMGIEFSFLPPLGNKIWENEESFLDSYIYNLNGFHIGFIRIPHYKGTIEDLEKFCQLIEQFEDCTDALVIDQLNNPGGYLLYQYALLSALTNHPLETPKHRLSITASDVLFAYQDLKDLDKIQTDDDALNNLPEDFFIKTRNVALFLKNFCHFIINEWNHGRTITNPIYLDGVDFINPHPKSRYTKPIVMLINELDFSGGDFVPAILQDNKRATLFGTKTAGAGGCVKHFSFPNLNGIERLSYTCSIAERKDGKPIENLGVIPDIIYNLTEEDIKNNYRPYVEKLNEVILKIINN